MSMVEQGQEVVSIKENSAGGISEAEVVQMLRDHPDVFQRNPELLELVSLSDTRGTSSLLERQVSVLKQRLLSMQSQQSELIEAVRENEQISDSFASIICQLIGYQSLAEFATEFPKALRSTFAIDEVSFKTVVGMAQLPDEAEHYANAVERLPNKLTVCDNRWPLAIINLFFSQQLASAALVPMKHSEGGELIGVLALGSKDPERYTHELGTAHLDRLGLMAGICIHRLQPNG